MGPQSRWLTSEKILLLVAFSLTGLHVAHAAAVDSEELKPLYCLLQNTDAPCSEVPVVPEVWDRLNKMYTNFSEVTKQAASAGMLEILKPNEITRLPAFINNLIPMSKLSSLNGFHIGAIVSRDPGNLAVLMKLSQLLKTRERWAQFIDQVKNVRLPTESQEILGKSLALTLPHPNNWTFNWFNETLSAGTPLMAHLPPDFLYSLSKSAAPMFVYHLRSWYWGSMGSANPWPSNSWSVLRRWATFSMEISYPTILSNWSSEEIRSNSFFLYGAMPDELQELSQWHLREDTTSVNWGKLQARVLFNKNHSSGILTEQQFNEALPLIPKLAPTDLQRFPVNTTNFKQLTFTSDMSFITAKQVAEALIAQAVVQGSMSSDDPAHWKKNISYLGSFVFVLPPHSLKPYLTFPLDGVLPEIDSYQLSPTQARYLTSGSSYVKLMVPQTILALSGNLLHTLDSKSVALAQVGDMSYRVRLHLLAHVPPGAPVRSFVLLQKVRNSIGDSNVLESMLSNQSPEQFFSLLLPMEVAEAAGQMSRALLHLAEVGYESAIKRLPHNVLSTLLSVARRNVHSNGEGWNEGTLLNSPSLLFLLGLSCNDVNAIESTDVMAILEKYNRERIALGQEFPKDLQYCVQAAVTRYLETKAKLNGKFYPGANLLDHLDVSEIMAVGGYAFASLPVKVISQTPLARTILQAIGSLSLPELLLAKSGNAGELANLFVKELTGPENDHLVLGHLLSLGNLLHFLNVGDVGRVNPRAFRQFLELQNGQTVWTTVCSPLDARAAWASIVEAAFGTLEKWTAGVLVTLGDFLAVLPAEKLDRVRSSSWQAAADSLVVKTRYHTKLQWPGELKPLMLYRVCGKLTDKEYPDAVEGLARRYLLVTQFLLQTVRPAKQLLRYKASSSSEESELELAPLGNLLLPRKVMGQSGNIKDRENRTLSERNLSSNTLAAAVPAEQSDFSAFWRSKRDSGKTEENQQYEDVLRSIETASQGSVDVDVPSAMPSPTKRFSEVYAASTKVSCDAVRASGPVAGLGLITTDVENMSLDELEDCLDVLGSLALPTIVIQQVWTQIRHYNLPFHLADLGSLVAGVSVQDLEKISMDQKEAGALDTLAALSKTVTDVEVVKKIVQLFTDANFKSLHPQLGAETMLALGKIACNLSLMFLRKIANGKEVFHASAVLAEIDTCDWVCLRAYPADVSENGINCELDFE